MDCVEPTYFMAETYVLVLSMPNQGRVFHEETHTGRVSSFVPDFQDSSTCVLVVLTPNLMRDDEG